MVPFPLRSITNQASSELPVVQLSFSLPPILFKLKSTPVALLVRLKPLPDTSINIGVWLVTQSHHSKLQTPLSQTTGSRLHGGGGSGWHKSSIGFQYQPKLSHSVCMVGVVARHSPAAKLHTNPHVKQATSGKLIGSTQSRKPPPDASA